MKKSLIIKSLIILLIVSAASCTKDALRNHDLEGQLDATESVNDAFLLASIIKQSCLFYEDMAYENSKLPGAVQYMERNFQGSDNYYAGFKTPADDLYTAMSILKLVDDAMQLADKRGSVSYKGIYTIFRVLLFSFATDFYGDIYYSQALKGREGILYPNYDKQSDIYAGLLSELEQANTMIAEGSDEISTSYDIMFGGDKLQWQKFANSLRLRLLMRASVKISDAGTQMQAILDNPSVTPVFTEADDNASIAYIGTNADNSWNGGTLNWSTDEEFDKRRPCKTLADKLTALNDPRLQVWIAPVEKPWTSDKALDGVTINTTDPNGFSYTSQWEYIDRTNPAIAAQSINIIDSNKLYVGFIAGMPGDWKNGNGHYDTDAGGVTGNFKVSKFSQLFRQNDHPLLKAMIMNSDEVQFILAEAAAKGMIQGNVNEYYHKGITYSLERWGVGETAVNDYLAQEQIALPDDTPGRLAKIADQKWLALFLVTAETYLDLRRTQLPNIFDNGNLSTYEFPLRYRYPGNELGLNKDAYEAGVGDLQPAVDDEQSKMWLLQ